MQAVIDALYAAIDAAPLRRGVMPADSPALADRAYRFSRRICGNGLGRTLETPNGWALLLSQPPHHGRLQDLIEVPDQHWMLLVYIHASKAICFVDPFVCRPA